MLYLAVLTKNTFRLVIVGEEERAKKELATLKKEHSRVEKQIMSIMASSTFDQLLVQRLKRQKLLLKDRIAVLYEFLYEDIIA